MTPLNILVIYTTKTTNIVGVYKLKAKINWSCKFNKKSYQIIEGYLRIVEHTNLAYVEPHKVIIGDKLYLFFNEQKHFYIGNLKKKILLLLDLRLKHEYKLLQLSFHYP